MWWNDALASLFMVQETVQDLVTISDPDPNFNPLPNALWDTEDLLKLLIRFTINIGFMFVLIRYIYYPAAKRKDFLFTYFLIGITIFLLCFMLENVNIKMGLGLGLFAIFGIIRYRTDPIPIKEMTYLFIVIAIAVMNALVNKRISLSEMAFANGIILLATYGLEKVWLVRHESQKVVLYENIELIRKGRREDLIADLSDRTGININRIEIGRIDFLRDTALIKIYYFKDEQPDQGDEIAGNSFRM